MHSTTRFLQGIYPFEGRGMDKAAPLHPDLSYRVPVTSGQFADALPLIPLPQVPLR